MPEKIPKETPSFYAIITADVRYSNLICMGAKLLFAEITALCNKHGFCWASNNYFAELYSKDTNTISRWVKELADAGFINPEIDKKSGNQRRIYLSTKLPEAINKISQTPTPKNVVTPIPVNGEHNNTGFNNKDSNSTTKGKAVQKLSLQERKQIFFNSISTYKKKNRGKLPDLLYEQFFTYWTEVNELNGGEVMRFEKQEFFEIGKRIATFWSKVDDEKRREMWKQQELTVPSPASQLDFGNLLKTNVEEWK